MVIRGAKIISVKTMSYVFSADQDLVTRFLTPLFLTLRLSQQEKFLLTGFK
jgi:hypothetical protein